MKPSRNAPVTRYLVAMLAFGVTACSVPRASLGEAGTSTVGDFETYRVAYLVQCRGCTVFATGVDEVGEVEGQWTRTVRVDRSTVPMVTLTATPSGAGYVARAYIEVEGEVVAEARRTAGDVATDVMLSAPLAPRDPSGTRRQPNPPGGWGN